MNQVVYITNLPAQSQLIFHSTAYIITSFYRQRDIRSFSGSFLFHRVDKDFDQPPDFIARPSEVFHDFFAGTEGRYWIPDGPVVPLYFGRCPRAGCFRILAERNDDIHGFEDRLIDHLRFLLRDVNTNFLHDTDGPWMQACRDKPRAEGFDYTFTNLAGQPFGHLASAGIAGTEKHHS